MDATTTVPIPTDQLILNGLQFGQWAPKDVGLSRVEVRFYAAESRPSDDPDACDLVSVLYDGNGKRLGSYLHCGNAHSDEPGNIIEGIGAEYAYDPDADCRPEYATVSYLTDDRELMVSILSAIANNPAGCGYGTELR